MLPDPDDEKGWERVYRGVTAGSVPGGGAADMYPTGKLLLQRIHPFGIPAGRFLDFGSGNGRLTPHALPHVLSYTGADVVPASVQFCERTWPDLEWVLLPDKNGLYNPSGTLRSQLPWEDDSFDSLAALSVFTHLGPVEEACHYAQELARVLRPGCRAVISVFESPPNDTDYGADRTVYTSAELEAIFEPFDKYGQDGGLTTAWHDQKYLYLSGR